MNVTPVTNDTANNGEQGLNNQETNTTQPVEGASSITSPAQENSSLNGETNSQTDAAEVVSGGEVEPAGAVSTETPPAQETATAAPEEASAEAGAAESTVTEDGAVQVDAEAIQQKVEENAPPVSLMEQLLNENEAASSVRRLEYGQAIEGILMYKDRDDMLVDIGTKSEGIVPQRERQSLSADKLSEMRVGDKVLVVVVRPESGADGEDGPILSIDKARTEVSWRKLQQQFEAGEVFEVDVVGYNKGGLMVEVEGVRGFIPASQVNALSGIGDSEENRQSQMSRLVNTKLLVKIVEVNRDRNRLILSERQAVREQREASKGRLMNELEVGQVREGIVTTLAKFGAFIDLGGVDGLVHVSELSWARIDDPKQILSVGQPVKVYILGIDQDKQKVALSIKRTQPEPWSQVTEKYHVGELVEATISQLSNFGAFARIEEGLEGLIHISELAEGRVDRPGDIVKPGDKVKVRILRIDPENRRLALSLKRAQEGSEEPTSEE
jgi:small subunit ribosomal protein S1